MYRQKIIAAVCIISALVVVARAAEVTTSGCLKSVQAIQANYAPKLQSVAYEFATSFTNSPNFDMKAFMDEVNQILSGYMNIANPQTNLSPRAIFDTFTGLVGSQLNLFTKYALNAGLNINTLKATNHAISRIIELNVQTLSDVTASCIPGSS